MLYVRGKWKCQSLSRVLLFATPWTVAYQAPPAIGFFQARVLEWVAIRICLPIQEMEKIYGFDPWVRKVGESMAAHSSIVAWRISWTEEPGGLQPMESQRVRRDWSDLAQYNWKFCKTQILFKVGYLSNPKVKSWWWTGSPGVLWFMGSQRVRQDWATDLNWFY